MEKREIQKLINIAIEACNDTITTDWLTDCLSQSVEIEVLEERTVTEKRLIKGGIPAVETYKITDNDFFNSQGEEFKQYYSILDRPEFSICIEKIQDIQILDSENVNVIKQQTYFKFRDTI